MPRKRKSAQKQAADNRKKLAIAERRQVVAANILAGASYKDIGDHLGVSPATVCSDFKEILKEWRKNYAHEIDDWVNLQLRRIDILINAIWDNAKGGADRPPDYAAIDRIMKLMERQSKLLGLDAPEKKEFTAAISFTDLLKALSDGDD